MTTSFARLRWLSHSPLASIALVLLLLASVGCASTQNTTTANNDTRSNDQRQAQDLVEQSRMTLDNFMADQTIGDPVRSLLRRAKAVVIFPGVLKAAFLVGASGGNGVALARDAQGRWSNPAFYTVGGGSFGFQAGGESSEILLIVMSDRGLASLQATSAKLGADAGIAAGPVGVGAAAATANLSADIVSYLRNKGLFAGVSLSGAVLATRDALNQAYYGRPISSSDILVRHAASNPQSARLVGDVQRASS